MNQASIKQKYYPFQNQNPSKKQNSWSSTLIACIIEPTLPKAFQPHDNLTICCENKKIFIYI